VATYFATVPMLARLGYDIRAVLRETGAAAFASTAD
jgi:hypothetical protein